MNIPTNNKQYDPIVSIVIPTLNEEENIEDLLRTSYMQTYRPLELVIVDGGSTDNSLKLIRKLSKILCDEYFTIQVLEEQDYGWLRSPANARNLGIQESKGNYLILLDSDTHFIKDNSISQIKKALEKVPFVRVNTKFLIDTELEYHISLNYNKKYNCGFNREVFQLIQFDTDLGYGEDRFLWYKMEKILKIDLNAECDTTLGRHLPHTFRQYLTQAKWYGETFPNYLKKVSQCTGNTYSPDIYSIIIGTFLSLFPIPFLLLTLKRDSFFLRVPGRLKYLILQFLRRYFFLFYFIRSSIKLKTTDVIIKTLITYLKRKVL